MITTRGRLFTQELPHFSSGVVSSFSSVSTTNTASSFAGAVLLAFSLTAVPVTRHLGEALAGAIGNDRPIIDRTSDRSFENSRIDES